MKETFLHLSVCAIIVGLLFAASMPSVFAQSQALNGKIEGTISDQKGAAVANAIITATNKISGAVSYRFRRPSFYSRPFFYPSPADMPDNKSDNFTATIGVPIIRDRWYFYI